MSDRPAIDGARALLATAQAGGLREAHVATNDFACFVAFAPGCANPLRQAAQAAPVAVDEVVAAPHVATLVAVVAPGTSVATGGRVATLRVLDREVALAAPCDGVVTKVFAAVGDLVEYDMPVVGVTR